jgi:hypothetical protein
MVLNPREREVLFMLYALCLFASSLTFLVGLVASFDETGRSWPRVVMIVAVGSMALCLYGIGKAWL